MVLAASAAEKKIKKTHTQFGTRKKKKKKKKDAGQTLVSHRATKASHSTAGALSARHARAVVQVAGMLADGACLSAEVDEAAAQGYSQ